MDHTREKAIDYLGSIFIPDQVKNRELINPHSRKSLDTKCTCTVGSHNTHLTKNTAKKTIVKITAKINNKQQALLLAFF